MNSRKGRRFKPFVRSVAVWLIACMMFSLSSVAFAAPAPYEGQVEVGDAEGAPGDTVNVAVYVTPEDIVFEYDIYLEYDANVLEPVQGQMVTDEIGIVSPGDFMAHYNDQNPGVIQVEANLGAKAIMLGQAKVFTAHFRIKNDAAFGATQVEVGGGSRLNEVDWYVPTVQAGTVQVLGAPPTGAAVVEIGSASGLAGATVQVPVTVTDASADIGAYEIEIHFDTAALEITAVTGETYDYFDWNQDQANGWLRAAWADSDGGDTPVRAGDKLFTITFQIKSSASTGDKALTVPNSGSISDFSVTDTSLQEMDKTLQPGKVTVAALSAIGNRTVNEGSELTFTATVANAGVLANAPTFSLADAPTGAAIDPATGVFTWTPTEAQGPGSYTFKVLASDGAGTAEESITVTVSEVNTAPVLGAIGNKTVAEGNELTFTAATTDADIPANTLTYSLADAPAGAVINPATGVFTWTPTEAQGPDEYTFTVRVSDGTATDEETITVTVNEVNAAPVLNAIGNRTVNEGSELTFTATATDSDIPVNTLTYSLDDEPTGAAINSTTGVFTWTPTEAQGPGSYTFKVLVSDGTATDEESITVTVSEVNTAPVLSAIGNRTVDEGSELTFTVTATDADLPANTLTYSLANAPAGAAIDPATGVFTWTPTEAQGPGSYTFTVRVSDGTATDEESITVTVSEVNTAPVLNAIGNKTAIEGIVLTFTATTADADLPANTLTYSLTGAPTGAAINPATGVFTWTPTEEQGPGEYTFTVSVSDGIATDEETITVTVSEANTAPVLGAIGNRTVNEGSELTFTAVATDADIPVNTLTYSLADAPTGAAINPATGVFTWTPTEAQGPGSYTFKVIASDGAATDEETITVTVSEVNMAPVLGAIGNKTANEGSELTFTAAATDADLPANTLTYSLDGAPAGAAINASTGVFTWTPTEAQGPDEYTFTVRVSDGTATDEETITVTVNEVNAAPVLNAIGNRTVNEGSELTFTATATDADIPVNTLTYSLADEPTGAAINPTTGVFTWTPTEAQGPGSYTFKVLVSDGTATDEESITVTVSEVNTAPVLSAIGNRTVDEGSELTFTATATDADLPANTLTYSLTNAPTGAAIDPVTGVFAWTPTEAQGPGSYTFTVRVSDGTATDEESITVTVNEANAAPVLSAIGNQSVNEGSELTFTATAADTDVPANTLVYSLIDAPAGAAINPATGVFTWTPTEEQGPGEYTFTVSVSDGTATDGETITVAVSEVNTAPVLEAIGNRTVDEGSELTFTAVATDADIPVNTLTYSLADAPEGAGIDAATGVFTWTPTEAQGPHEYTFKVIVSDGTATDEETIIVTVNEVNTPPVLNAIGKKAVDEGSKLTFTATATDADLPANTLTYSLIDAPAGAAIDAETGVFTWQLTGSQGPKDYKFKVSVSDGTATAEEEITVTVHEVIYYFDNGNTGVEIWVNGKLENAGTAKTDKVNGQQVITVKVEEEKLQRRLEAEGDRAVITIPVSADSDVVVGELNGRMVKNMENKQATVAIRTDKATYTLPAAQINIDAISSQVGASVALQDIKVKIEIAVPTNETVQVVQKAASDNELAIVIPPVNFSVTAEYDGRTYEVEQFNAYVERTIAIPDGVDPSRITTGVVIEADGTVRHVPTKIVQIEGRYYAQINSLTNSTYTVVWNPLTFGDMDGHWAQQAVNNMGSRLVVDGVDDTRFSPDRNVTRAEFAAILVRGLGLRQTAGASVKSIFTDTSDSAWYAGAVRTSYEYGLIGGFEDGTFRPHDSITREQAMVMLAKAMAITSLPGAPGDRNATELLRAFADAQAVSSWAQQAAADTVSAGIVSGRNDMTLAPQAPITRAEAAMLMERLLQLSGLIN